MPDTHTPAEQVERAHMRQRACALRARGLSYRNIANILSVSAMTAHAWVQTALSDIPREDAKNVLTLELERCDVEYRSADRIQSKFRAASEHDIDAAEVVLKATATKLRIMDRRAKYLGLDAPSKQEVTGQDGAPLLPADQSKLTPADACRIVGELFKPLKDSPDVAGSQPGEGAPPPGATTG
jgi:hypothetical protein